MFYPITNTRRWIFGWLPIIEVLLAGCGWRILGEFSCLNWLVLWVLEMQILQGGGGYTLSLSENTATSHSLRANELKGGCFHRLTLSRKTGTPETISGMFIASRPVRWEMKSQKITAKLQHGLVTTSRLDMKKQTGCFFLGKSSCLRLSNA